MTTLDLTNGYIKIPAREPNIPMTVFILTSGIYAVKRMPFVLSGTHAMFQKLMKSVLASVLNTFVHVYLEDIVMTSTAFEGH